MHIDLSAATICTHHIRFAEIKSSSLKGTHYSEKKDDLDRMKIPVLNLFVPIAVYGTVIWPAQVDPDLVNEPTPVAIDKRTRSYRLDETPSGTNPGHCQQSAWHAVGLRAWR